MTFQLNIYRPDLSLDDVISHGSVERLDYDRVLNDIGKLAFTISANNKGSIDRDWIVEVIRYADNTQYQEGAYSILLIEEYEDESGTSYVTFGGFSLEDYLARRIIDPSDDPLGANGYSTKSGGAESVFHSYVEEQLGSASSRPLDNFTQKPFQGLGLNLALRVGYELLFKILKNNATNRGVDFRINFSSSGFEFETGRFGTDKSKTANSSDFTLFSKKRGNIAKPKLVRDYRKASNVIYGLAEGEGDNQNVFKYNTSDMTASTYARREMSASVNDTEADNALQVITKTQAEISKHEPVVNFTFEVIRGYRTEWDLGDRVTAEHNGFEQDMTIEKITIRYNKVREIIRPTLEKLPS